MTTHDDRARKTGEILAGTAVWADEPEVLGSVLAEIDVSRRPRGRWMAAAAAFALVVAVGSVILTRPAPVDFTLAGTELAPAASAEVRLVETPAGIVLRLEVQGLEPAAPGTYYQGWVVSDAAEVSVGTFHMRGGDGSVAGILIFALATRLEGASPASSNPKSYSAVSVSPARKGKRGVNNTRSPSRR